jgi:hypothetical protein
MSHSCMFHFIKLIAAEIQIVTRRYPSRGAAD